MRYHKGGTTMTQLSPDTQEMLDSLRAAVAITQTWSDMYDLIGDIHGYATPLKHL